MDGFYEIKLILLSVRPGRADTENGTINCTKTTNLLLNFNTVFF